MFNPPTHIRARTIYNISTRTLIVPSCFGVVNFAGFRCTKTSVNKRLLLCPPFYIMRDAYYLTSVSDVCCFTSASDGILDIYSIRVNELHNTILAENQRLVISAVLLNYSAIG